MPIIYNYTGSVDEKVPAEEQDLSGLGLVYPFGSSNTAFDTTKTTLEVAKVNLLTLLQTTSGERMMLPDFGIGIKQFCFEPMTEDTKVIITDRIRSNIRKWVPYVTIKNIKIINVDVANATDWNALQITVNFYLNDNPEIGDMIIYEIKP